MKAHRPLLCSGIVSDSAGTSIGGIWWLRVLIHHGFAMVGKLHSQSSDFTALGGTNAANAVAAKAGAVTKRAAGPQNPKKLSATKAQHSPITLA